MLCSCNLFFSNKAISILPHGQRKSDGISLLLVTRHEFGLHCAFQLTIHLYWRAIRQDRSFQLRLNKLFSKASSFENPTKSLGVGIIKTVCIFYSWFLHWYCLNRRTTYNCEVTADDSACASAWRALVWDLAGLIRRSWATVTALEADKFSPLVNWITCVRCMDDLKSVLRLRCVA